jgi:hypothetical protein
MDYRTLYSVISAVITQKNEPRGGMNQYHFAAGGSASLRCATAAAGSRPP